MIQYVQCDTEYYAKYFVVTRDRRLQIHKPSVETVERINLNKLYLPSIARKNQCAH